METLDIIRQMCSSTGISISQLENELGYGNGSIAKAKNMSADRIYQIAQYFGVSMEYLMTGKTINETDDEIALLRQQQSILIDINKINQEMTEYYKKIADCQSKLTSLKKEYNKIENKKKSQTNPTPDGIEELPWDGIDEELPFS